MVTINDRRVQRLEAILFISSLICALILRLYRLGICSAPWFGQGIVQASKNLILCGKYAIMSHQEGFGVCPGDPGRSHDSAVDYFGLSSGRYRYSPDSLGDGVLCCSSLSFVMAPAIVFDRTLISI